VKILDSAADLFHADSRLVLRQWAVDFLHVGEHVAVVDILYNHINFILVKYVVKHLDDVLVLKLGPVLQLAQQERLFEVLWRFVSVDYLDSDLARPVEIVGFLHL